jgi:hypothetical protein
MRAEKETSTSVWAAEHGASSPAAAEPEGANAGHRFRIHGRLGQQLPEQLEGEEPPASQADNDAGERLRERLAQATEIDTHDVQIEVDDEGVELHGTVSDDGERRQLQDLVGRLSDGKPITSHLRARNP